MTHDRSEPPHERRRCRSTRTSSGATRSPSRSYDAVIVGGGGHGLATAYYLAKNHGMTNIAVLEKGWLAGGNMARNTTIIRSNYLWDESAAIYEHALKLWEGLPEELDYDFLFSQRGVLNLAHTLGDVRDSVRRVGANKLNGVDAEWLDPQQVKELCPILNITDRHPLPGDGRHLPAAGRHRQARPRRLGASPASADELGVDIIQNCEVTGFVKDGDRVVGRQDQPRHHQHRKGRPLRGRAQLGPGRHGRASGCPSSPTRCRRWSPSCTSRSTPPWSCPTTCTSTSPRRTRANWSWAPASTRYNGYGQRGSFHVIEQPDGRRRRALPDLRPGARAADLGRASWTPRPDASPIVGTTPVENMFVNCGWGTGGFKATPGAGWCLRRTPSPPATRTRCNKPFALERFDTGALIDEHGAAAVAH